jgi:FtsH-binding integral membrane protein
MITPAKGELDMPTDRNLPRARTTTVRDAGLQAFFRQVYNNLALGLTFTGVVAWMVANSPTLLHFFFGNHVMALVIVFSPLLILMFGLTPRRVATMSSSGMAGVFYLLSTLFGISFATIFLMYSGESIARVFFITAGMFAGMSIVGYSAQRDLTQFGSFLLMGLFGVILAGLVNMFMHSAMLMYLTSMIGVIVFTGFIAWDTQKFKEIYSNVATREDNQKLALLAALSLYLDFINLFQLMLSLMGGNRR